MVPFPHSAYNFKKVSKSISYSELKWISPFDFSFVWFSMIIQGTINVYKFFSAFYLHFKMLFYGEGNGNPLQYSCLENPMDGGAW